MSGTRRNATGLAVIAALVLLWMENPWFRPEQISDQARTVATIAFWILSIIVVVLLFTLRNDPGAAEVEVEGPAFTRFLFHNTTAGLFWLPIRLFLGFEWITASVHKITGTGWLDGGAALKGFWTSAVAIPDTGRAAITFDWYRDFLNFLLSNHAYTWFAPFVAFGELAVGVGLVVGCLTGIAAFFGALMNMSFLLAGSASTNPIMFAFAVGLILAWRVAGYYGVDRYLLPMLGTPWRAKVATHTMPGMSAG